MENSKMKSLEYIQKAYANINPIIARNFTFNQFKFIKSKSPKKHLIKLEEFLKHKAKNELILEAREKAKERIIKLKELKTKESKTSYNTISVKESAS